MLRLRWDPLLGLNSRVLSSYLNGVAEASLAVPRRACDSWLLVSTSSPPLAGKALPLLATMDRATLLRAATAYLHARDVRALRITAPAAQSHAISIQSED